MKRPYIRLQLPLFVSTKPCIGKPHDYRIAVFQDVSQVLALQQGLYGAQLKLRLQRLAAEESDFAQLGAVHRTAQAHGLEDVARRDLSGRC